MPTPTPIPTLPVLRRGEVYQSLDSIELKSVRTGEPVANVNQANSGLIKRDLRKANESRRILRAIPSEQMIAICKKAGDLFLNGEVSMGEGLGTQTPEEYMDALSHTSGLPLSLIRRNMAKIHIVFTEMPTILAGLTRGMDLSVIDKGYGEQAGVPVSFFAVTDTLGAVLPSNSPGVNSLWIPAVALKIPVILKPGREEPWTPYRIIRAFIAAGCPPEAFSFYPTDHEGSATILQACDRALVFGDVGTVKKYEGNPGVQVHGPGWSKVLIGKDQIERWPEFIEVIAASIAENGGRSCINASAVIVPAHGDEIAAALAERLAKIVPLPASDENATLAGFANPKMAEFIDAAITEGLTTPGAVDCSAQARGPARVQVLDGSTYLLPTIIRCQSFDHPLAGKEFLFPYASVVEMPQEQMLEKIGPSLVVTAITEDPAFIEDVIASPNIERLNLGALPTSRVEWNQPHEGNLFEFLYRRRAIQRA